MDNMNKASENYLTGKCLVSMPNMADERFERSLIYICSHTKDGAMGFVVNKKLKSSPSPIWPINCLSARLNPLPP